MEANMKDTNELNLEIERIKGDIRLINQSLNTIKNNHLFHIEKSISQINKILWTVGVMMLAQFIMIIKDALVG
jgi:hypothetical protein